jgi:hypothetical protein
MKNNVVIVFFSLFLPLTTFAQFPAKGSYWIYENEGVDKHIKKIKIERGDDTSIVKNSVPANYTKFPITYLDSNNKAYSAGKYVLWVDQVNTCATMLFLPSTNEPCVFSYSNSLGTMQTAIANGNGIQDYLTVDSIKVLTINGVQLKARYISGYIKSRNNNKCFVFCSPFVDRLGSIGYFLPLDICKQDTIYAGKLLTYYDTQIGVYNIPDSLRKGPCSFDKKSGVDLSRQDQFVFKLFPNPCFDQITVTYRLANTTNTKLLIFDVMGKEISQYNLTEIGDYAQIDVRNMKQGLYFYQVIGPTKLIANGKFIKEN